MVPQSPLEIVVREMAVVIPETDPGRELINQSAVNVPICINLARFANYLAQDFAKKWRTIDETNPAADISVNINSRV